MRESSERRAVWVGLFVFAGIALLIALVFMVGNLRGTFTQKMQVVGIFDDVNGLQSGNNVWFSGVKVGTVNDIRLYDQSQVLVTVNIDVNSMEYIRKDAKIKISSDGLIGNKILVIYGGSPQAGMVEVGDTLAVEKTLSSEDMLNMVQKNNENLLAITADFKAISAGIVAGEGSIGKLLIDTLMYDHVLASTASLEKASARIVQVMNALQTFTTDLNAPGGLPHDLVTDSVMVPSLQASIFRIESMVDTATTIINELKAISTDPNSTVGVLLRDEQTAAQLQQVIDNLESSTYKLDENLEALKHNFLLKGYFKKKEKGE